MQEGSFPLDASLAEKLVRVLFQVGFLAALGIEIALLVAALGCRRAAG